MKIDEALTKLYSMHKLGVKLGLENTKHLLNYLGNPHRSFPSVHIAGSNGKGSVASFTASMLQEEGLRVGLYTSPHFVRFNERVKINGKEIPDEFIAGFINDLESYIDKHTPTFFEITTALAFKYFSEMKIDYGVIETGLGGRLDSTNLIEPQISVITTISHEHTNILGESLEEIAREKGGIIKRGVPVALGIIENPALETLCDIARKKNAHCYKLMDYISEDEGCVKLNLKGTELSICETPLRGEYQLKNAALAALAYSVIRDNIELDVIKAGVKNVLANTLFQGRYEVFNESPKVIFDASHNLEGMQLFLKEFAKEKDCYNKKIAIFGAMNDKNISGMLKILAQYFDNIFVTSINYERSARIEELQLIAERNQIEVKPLNNPAEYIADFIKKNNSNCLVALGSIYILGDIKTKLLDIFK